MYPQDTPNISDGAANHVYSITQIGDRLSVRSEAAAPADQPANIRIRHEDIGTGISARRRSNVSFLRVVEDANGEQGNVIVSYVIDRPIKIATNAQATKTHTEFTNFMAIAGYVDKLLNAEI